MTERRFIDTDELERTTGLALQDVLRVADRAAGIGVPPVEDVGVLGQTFYRLGRLCGDGWNLLKKTGGSVLVIPRAEEAVVIIRRDLTGKTSFSLGRGLRRHSEADIDRDPGLVSPGRWVLTIPIMESPRFVNVVTHQEFTGIPDIQPELPGIVADLKILQVHGFARFINPVRTITHWRSQERAKEELGDSILDVAAGNAFNNEMFIAAAKQIARALTPQPEKLTETTEASTPEKLEEEEKEKVRAVIASSTLLVTAALKGFLGEAARAQAGLSIVEVAVEVGYPEELQKAVQAGVEAEALQTRGMAEARVLEAKADAVAGAVEKVVEPLIRSLLEKQT